MFGIRRASGVARLSVSDVKTDSDAGALEPKVSRQNNDQYGFGQLSHFLEVQSWGRPVMAAFWLDNRGYARGSKFAETTREGCPGARRNPARAASPTPSPRYAPVESSARVWRQ